MTMTSRFLTSLCLLGVLSYWVLAPVASASPANQDVAAIPNIKLKSMMVEYQQGGQALEGYLAYNESQTGKRPGILVIHDWTGLGDYTKQRVDQLAKLGYVAFAADIYGKGIHPKPPKETGEMAGKFKNDRALFRARAQAGLAVLRNFALTDTSRLAAIGYCFGGTGVLELGRAGADLKGLLSFHGGLDSPTRDEGKYFKGKVLILHGADDPFIPVKDITDFQDEMRQGKVDWQMIYYSNAVHAFTIPGAGNDNSKGAAYNASADKRSWADMQQFFAEIF